MYEHHLISLSLTERGKTKYMIIMIFGAFSSSFLLLLFRMRKGSALFSKKPCVVFFSHEMNAHLFCDCL